MRENAVGVFLVLLLLGFGLWFHYNPPQGRGILASPSGEASLITGEACTINAQDSRSANQIWEDMTWCMATIKSDRRNRGLP